MYIRHLLLLGFVATISAYNEDYVRFCYYTNWSQYRPEGGTFFPDDIDASLCSHIFYAFAVLDENNAISTYEYNDEILYGDLQALKSSNPDLKTLIAVGGWNFGMNQTTKMLETATTRSAFIDSAIPFAREFGFDGIDLDFEYPGAVDRGGRPEDKEKFTLLCQEFKAAIVAEAASSGNTQLLLTAAVGAGQNRVDAGYEVALIAQELDYINVMTYDFNGAWANYTGINAPLYGRDEEEGFQRNYNVNYTTNYWLQLGAIKERLVMGIPLYGRCFTLTSEETGLAAPADGPGPAGPYTREAGFYSNYEICSQNIGNKVFDEYHMAPYGWQDDIWVGFEDDRSIGCKVHYMMDMDLAGFFIWAIDLDDFSGDFCGNGAYPLMKGLLDVLDGNIHYVCRIGGGLPTTTAEPTTTTTGPTTTTTEPTTTTTNDPFCIDKQDGFYEHYSDCTLYIHCVSGYTYTTSCPACTTAQFTDDAFKCDYPCPDGICHSNPCEVDCDAV